MLAVLGLALIDAGWLIATPALTSLGILVLTAALIRWLLGAPARYLAHPRY
ncbi:hypothetical protein [Nocardia seriolae]|uniref:Uncharacterized protein n=1 Tax=Nocardia seriolae TaxID=37332 RepID=A0A0B8NNQ0_9NOCA|nr:hypothetical protein [Nocardia seriolae]APA99512.1 hypothetical protein NS506_05466 [Nocardia seriolae]MTJ63108.1 hypothetical protein [Nocardia seriolae]MTJ73568.1 hypothetical protein [Nocardia seriolae]MTJ89085.1 hypothetical protein [Nocardia seriolae]MTK33064.1 hypothetical protein [Nocardia seriolae]